MPPSKNVLLRYGIIDACLRRPGQQWPFTRLLQEVSAAVDDHLGTGSGVSVRTLREDLKNLKPGGASGLEAPIVYSRDRGYHYEDTSYSIYNSPLSLDDLPVLQGALDALKQLQGLGLSEDLSELVERLAQRLSYRGDNDGRVVLQFELPAGYQGQHWLGPLYAAVRGRQAVELGYQPFHAPDVRTEVVHPHLLKQYNGRWFLVAQRHGRDAGPSVFALDRVRAVEPTAAAKYEDSASDPSHLFAHMIGVSVLPQAEVQDVVLRFAAPRLPYVLTKPLHPSQEIQNTSDFGTLVKLRLLPTRELLTLLLSYGADVEVMSPAELRERMAEELASALRSYPPHR